MDTEYRGVHDPCTEIKIQALRALNIHNNNLFMLEATLKLRMVVIDEVVKQTQNVQLLCMG